MASMVATVLGDVPVADLGITDYHEHLFVIPPVWLHRLDPDYALSDEEKSASELSRWAAAGGRTLIEMTAPDFGRDLSAVRRIAERVPRVHVLVTSGFNRPWYMGRWAHELDEMDTIRAVVREVTKGIGATGIRARSSKQGPNTTCWMNRGASCCGSLRPLTRRPVRQSSRILREVRWVPSKSSILFMGPRRRGSA